MKVKTNKKLICKAERNFPNFKVEYLLFESTSEGDEKNFDIKALKSIKGKSSSQCEESLVENFEQSEDRAIYIFNKIVKYTVTPMCLEDSIYEFI